MITSKIMKVLLKEYEEDFILLNMFLSQKGIRHYILDFDEGNIKTVYIHYDNNKLYVKEC